MRAIAITEKDNVATALEDTRGGEVVIVHQSGLSKKIKVKGPIAFGHKFALQRINIGQDIIKYGEVIGKATATIESGEHVHVHNVESQRGRGDLPTKE